MVLTLYTASDGPPFLAVRMALKLLALDYKVVEVYSVAGDFLTEENPRNNPQKEIPVLDDDGFYLSESDGPPSLAVRMALKLLSLDYKVIEVDFVAGEFLTEEYARKNPQKEIPVLDDDGFYLSESNVIIQYLADKYGKDDSLYPADPQRRALVNHRLAFNLSTYYRAISDYALAPIFYAYERTTSGEKKVQHALSVFNTYLERLGKKYSADDKLTIADLPLVTATLSLEATDFDFSSYVAVTNWYARFKKEHPTLWSIAEEGMKELADLNKNPPDLSGLKHPLHPTRKP